MKKRDWTNFWIISFFVGVFGLMVFGVAVEILKFAALVKWVFA